MAEDRARNRIAEVDPQRAERVYVASRCPAQTTQHLADLNYADARNKPLDGHTAASPLRTWVSLQPRISASGMRPRMDTALPHRPQGQLSTASTRAKSSVRME